MLLVSLFVFVLLSVSAGSFLIKSLNHRNEAVRQSSRPFIWRRREESCPRVYRESSFPVLKALGANDAVSSETNGTSYSKKEVMLNVAKQSPSAAYRVQLPKGMEYPTLTAKQQIVADRMRESLKEDSGKSDLDLLKEELRIIIEKLG